MYKCKDSIFGTTFRKSLLYFFSVWMCCLLAFPALAYEFMCNPAIDPNTGVIINRRPLVIDYTHFVTKDRMEFEAGSSEFKEKMSWQDETPSLEIGKHKPKFIHFDEIGTAMFADVDDPDTGTFILGKQVYYIHAHPKHIENGRIPSYSMLPEYLIMTYAKLLSPFSTKQRKCYPR